MKAIGTILIAASLDLLILTQTCNTLDTFVGPGVIECNRGQCEFACPHSRRSCSDPCHTITRSSNLFTLSFRQVADVSGIQTYGGKQCYFKFAENVNSHFPDEYVEIAMPSAMVVYLHPRSCSVSPAHSLVVMHTTLAIMKLANSYFNAQTVQPKSIA